MKILKIGGAFALGAATILLIGMPGPVPMAPLDMCGNNMCEGSEADSTSASFCSIDCEPQQISPSGSAAVEEPATITYADDNVSDYWSAKTEEEKLTMTAHEVAPVPAPPQHALALPDDGHADVRHATVPGFRDYDIFVDNCHTAANEFCLIDPSRSHERGILVCGGDPQNSPAHHTANWEVKTLPDGRRQTCIYNWGQSRCWIAGAIPPDITNEPGLSNAKWACGNQYGDGTQVLEPGELVEIPGTSACVRETSGVALNSISVAGAQFRSNLTASCNQCCFRRASMWSGYGNDGTDNDFYQERAQFLTQCRTLCNGFFNNAQEEIQHVNDSLGIHQGRECADGASFFSASSYYEQCRGCCYDAAISGAITRRDVTSCMAVCNAEHR